jgi:hypothetical protein
MPATRRCRNGPTRRWQNPHVGSNAWPTSAAGVRRTGAGRSPSAVLEISDQVFYLFHTDRDPHQVVADTSAACVVGTDRGSRRRCRSQVSCPLTASLAILSNSRTRKPRARRPSGRGKGRSRASNGACKCRPGTSFLRSRDNDLLDGMVAEKFAHFGAFASAVIRSSMFRGCASASRQCWGRRCSHRVPHQPDLVEQRQR